MSPAQRPGIRQVLSGGNAAGLDQGPELEIDRIHVRVPVWVMAETAVGGAAGQGPISGLLDGVAAVLC